MISTDPGPEVSLRRAGAEDAAAVAEVYLAARKAAVPAMPPLVHGDDEVRRWLGARVAKPGPEETWVAVADGLVVGYARLTETWLDDLYVLPGWGGQGIGSTLLGLVKALRPAGFGLWVFESNETARRFYRRHGLFETERTDGMDNEEKAPDIRMTWSGAQDPRRSRGHAGGQDQPSGDEPL